MWRTRAIEQMLLEDIAGVRRSNGENEPAERPLSAARRSAWRAVAVDLVALTALLAARLGETPMLSFGPNIETIFTVGLLLVAVHAGFRLGQLEKLRAVSLLVDELAQRAER